MNLPKLFAPTRSIVDGKETTIEDFSKQGFCCILIIGKYYI
jgi:hypothetical protein